MKIAFIPPAGLEARVAHGDLVMALAQLRGNADYRRTVRGLSRSMTIIVDNGANEGEHLADELLADVGADLRADEMVLPDVLRDAEETRKAVSRFLEQEHDESTRYMAVVQGMNDGIRMDLINWYAAIPEISVLGLPRLLLNSNSLSYRIDLCNRITQEFGGRFKVHFLGASSKWIREVRSAAMYCEARSMDTSAPYNYAFYGEKIDNPSAKVDRPSNYFSVNHTYEEFNTGLIRYNEGIYLQWARSATHSRTA